MSDAADHSKAVRELWREIRSDNRITDQVAADLTVAVYLARLADAIHGDVGNSAVLLKQGGK